jgi:hypothetical protein
VIVVMMSTICFLVIESWRNTSTCASSFPVASFTTGGHFQRCRARVFRAVGVPVDWLDEYVEVAPRRSNGLMHLRHSLQESDAFEKVSAVCVHSMRWKRFSEARWLTAWGGIAKVASLVGLRSARPDGGDQVGRSRLWLARTWL